MRYIDLDELRPLVRDLLPDLANAAAQIEAEPDVERRAELLRNHRAWVRLRQAFSEYSYDKCWYTECKNPGTDDDVDHFRPKLRVAESDTHPGYYWLAYEWTNLRLSCHRSNRLRVHPVTGETGGKADHFPLYDEACRALLATDDIGAEVPLLLDPTNPADPPILTFWPNGEAALSPDRKGDPIAEAKFDASRLYLQLNWPALRDERLDLFNRIERLIKRGAPLAPTNYSGVHTASQPFKDVLRDLIDSMKPRAVYSAAAKAYVETFRHIWWIQEIVLKV